jgi:hypothetical protein
MDSKFRVPKTTFNVYILTPNVYGSPRTITAERLFQKVLNDDLNSILYDAVVAGDSYRGRLFFATCNLTCITQIGNIDILADFNCIRRTKVDRSSSRMITSNRKVHIRKKMAIQGTKS